MSDTLQLRIDAKIKNKAARVFDSLGLDLSSGIKIYLNQVVAYNGIPFSLITKNGLHPRDEDKLLNELHKAKRTYVAGHRRPHRNVKNMLKEILAE